MAAIGGVLAPIGIYLAFNATNPETVQGWGVPTATDIAFALGILALLGNRVPSGVRVFLSTLAVADDIIAILVIAVFYGHSPSMFWLGMAAAVLVVLVLMNRSHIYSLVPYLLVGAVLWYCVFMSGVHSTISRASSPGRATRFVRRATRSSPRRPSSRRATTSRP